MKPKHIIAAAMVVILASTSVARAHEATPDTTSPVYLLTGPPPLSHVEIILLVTEPADFSFEISSEQVEPFTLGFVDVTPGPYGGTIGCDDFIWERFQFRLLYKEAAVGKTMTFVHKRLTALEY